ncbi:reticulocalbin-2 [Malaya genurostris]|uniref:reticulocalbin-2 n=1 Tax=Malaya genurostris TaxID=325434 RepID=UPI0026F3DB35|nr:reticulocalbin-2 [Malaya genurostris]XP_058446232.1 reticulocalbin-2 [Malaya genurostris]XP_058446233.1 reticulocalbin-2 [Malaya genurostris]
MILRTGLLMLLIGALLNVSQSATTHKHSHQTANPGNKERLEDGSFANRDVHHMEGEDHRTEFDHEAILGSVKEAEEFDTLSPEESKKRLAKLVVKMDLNSDGFVDRHELKAWILRSFKSLLEEEATDRFEDIDQNADDIITWQEYYVDTYGMESEDDEDKPVIMDASKAEEKKLIADDKEMFEAADGNKDGKLDPSEFVLFMSPEEFPQMFSVVLKQTLRSKDTNSDGKIDFQEYAAEHSRGHDKEWLITEKDRFDNDFDKDGDGYLNGNEILSWILPSNEEVAEDEVAHLFVSSDEDHDDRLSYKEIIDKYDIFVGSEATDYGDHLQNIHHLDDEL